jgi:hypothetical protein
MTIGTVTAYTDDGEILKKWENVKLSESYDDSAFKTFGCNFYDSETGSFIVINNAVPCIIEYKVIEIDNTTDNNVDNDSDMLKRYKTLVYQRSEIIKLMANMDKQSNEYANTKENLKKLEHLISDVEWGLIINGIIYKN